MTITDNLSKNLINKLYIFPSVKLRVLRGYLQGYSRILIYVVYCSYARIFDGYFVNVFKCFYDVGVVWAFKVCGNAEVF